MRKLLGLLLMVFCFTCFSKASAFSGTNQYYLFYKPNKMIDSVLDDAKALNLTVMRTWAFCEGSSHDGYCFQPSLGSYDENTFKHFDYVVYAAGQRGIKLILTLVDNWWYYGGVDQYVRWLGLSNHDDFFRNAQAKEAYKAYVRYFLERTNTITGVKYKDDPTILAWELMNEPRCGDLPALYQWVDEMARFIKSIDPVHKISSGSEGSFVSDLVETHKSPAIDFVSFHLYPDHWGWDVERSNNYIREQARIAHQQLGKPIFFGEFGFKDKSRRRDVFKQWYQIMKEEHVDGAAFWLLSGRQMDGSLYPDYDGFTVWYPESTDVIDIIQEYGRSL